MISDQSISLDAQASLEKMERLIMNCRFDEFLNEEMVFYSKYIKSVETADHHERLFGLLDPIVRRYGEHVYSELGGRSDVQGHENSVCYFLPGLDNDLAHIEVLASVLRACATQSRRQVYIAGFGVYRSKVGSKLIDQLAREFGVKVLILRRSHSAILEFCRWFLETRVGLLIPYSIPTLLSAWIEIFGPSRVVWYVSKFELNSFRDLKFAISGGSTYEVLTVDGTTWRRVRSALPKDYKIKINHEPSSIIRIVSVNREEKIRDPIFLGVVARILLANPDTNFSWTGRRLDEFIDEYFLNRGLADRHKFVGWIDFRRELGKFDCLIDSFSLSGVVSASAFCAGMPALFMRGSRSWIEAYETELNEYLNENKPSLAKVSESVLAGSPEDFFQKLQSTIDKIRDGTFDGSWQTAAGDSCLFDPKMSGAQHLRALDEIRDCSE